MALAALVRLRCPKSEAQSRRPGICPYIKAYTGGMVPEDAVIRIDLTEDATGEDGPAGRPLLH